MPDAVALALVTEDRGVDLEAQAELDALLRLQNDRNGSDLHLRSGSRPLLRLNGSIVQLDEFAVLDQQGLVHPYPVPLSIRGILGQPAQKTPVEALGGQAGSAPLPVALVVVTAYQPGARWRPAALSAGEALLALMDNAVAARREPSYSMPILRATIAAATAVRSKRGEAGAVARALLRLTS